MTRSIPSISSSGKDRPQSTTTILSSYSKAVMFIPICSSPPSGMIFLLVSVCFCCFLQRHWLLYSLLLAGKAYPALVFCHHDTVLCFLSGILLSCCGSSDHVRLRHDFSRCFIIKLVVIFVTQVLQSLHATFQGLRHLTFVEIL